MTTYGRLLDGKFNVDTVAQGPTRGSLIYGNTTPAWDELAVGAANSVLAADGTDAAWDTTPTVDGVTVTGATVLNSSAGAAGDLTWNSDTLSPLLFADASADQILINTTSPSGSVLEVTGRTNDAIGIRLNHTSNATGASCLDAFVTMNHTAGGASYGTAYEALVSIGASGATDYLGSFHSMFSQTVTNSGGSGTIGNTTLGVVSNYSKVTHAGSGTMVRGIGFLGEVGIRDTSGPMTTAVGFAGRVGLEFLAANTITTGYAVAAFSPNVNPLADPGAAITNLYGVYIETQAEAHVGTSWGVYQVGTSDSNYLAGPTKIANVLTVSDPSDITKTLITSLGGATTAKTLTLVSSHTDNRSITFPDATGTLALTSDVDTARTWATLQKFKDTTFLVGDDGDITKAFVFSLAGATTAKTLTLISSHTDNRSITLPDATTTLAGLAVAQTFTTTQTMKPATDVANLELRATASQTANLLECYDESPSLGFFINAASGAVFTGGIVFQSGAFTQTIVPAPPTANRIVTLLDSSYKPTGFTGFTPSSGRVAFWTTGGFLTSDADMTFATDTLTITKIAATQFTGNVTFADAINVVTNATTGTKIGTATTQKLGFWNAAPIVQPATGGAASTFVANTSGIVNDTATFDSYTIGQVVKALRNAGILA